MHMTAKRFTVEKTHYINVEGKVIPISTLPDIVAQEFEVLDMMKEELLSLQYKVELISHAIKSKSNDLGLAVQKCLEETHKDNEDERSEKVE